jgi:hypothetical protein
MNSKNRSLRIAKFNPMWKPYWNTHTDGSWFGGKQTKVDPITGRAFHGAVLLSGYWKVPALIMVNAGQPVEGQTWYWQITC